MNPFTLEPSDKAKAGFAKAHYGALNADYFSGLDSLLSRARLMAKCLADAADSADFAQSRGVNIEGPSAAQTAAQAFAIAQQIEMAEALLNGFNADLQALRTQAQTAGKEGRP